MLKTVSPINVKQELNAAGAAPIYAARAWVNFRGSSTVDIRQSGNVSSITDNGTGDFTVNFAIAMQDADFACVATYGTTLASALSTRQVFWTGPRAASSVRLYGGAGAIPSDEDEAQVVIFR